jgi:hypothetical protein
LALSPRALHALCLEGLGNCVLQHSELKRKPLEVLIDEPLNLRCQIFAFNLVSPSKQRLRDHKIVLGFPGIKRGDHGAFDFDPEQSQLLLGYSDKLKVWALWEARYHQHFTSGENVQVANAPVFQACGGGIHTVRRALHDGNEEIVRVCQTHFLLESITQHIESLTAAGHQSATQ